MTTKKICYNEDKTVHVSILLSAPEPEEPCPITSETIGSSTFSPPYVKIRTQQPKRAKFKHTTDLPFSDGANLSCAQMALCGHRFDARALMIHFMRNSMSCPICRAGHSVPLSARQSFPDEPWICEMEEAIHEEARREKNNQINDDIVFAVGLEREDRSDSLLNLILGTLTDHRVAVSFFLFNTPTPVQDYAVHAMQLELDLLPLQLRHRDLSQGVSLYSSFSSSSLLTPEDRPSSPVVRQPPAPQADPPRAPSEEHNNSRHFIVMGGHILSIDDISVQYSMSETNLRQLSRVIQQFGVLSMCGNIFATRIIDGRSTGPTFIGNIQRFNLNASDSVQILHVTPSTDVVSLRSQEEREHGNFQINRFDYVLSSASLMRLFFELS